MSTPAPSTLTRVPICDLGREYADLRAQLDPALARVLTSGSYILGKETVAFEAELAAYLNVSEAVGVNSGTDALLLALRALGIEPGDEVIVPAMTFIASAEPIALLGARPVFVDIDPISFALDPTQVKKALTPRTKAIVVVHLYGQAADMTALATIAAVAGVPIVEDMAQAIGATWQGKKVGGFGALGCVSFFPTKNLGAYGDGGAVVTSSKSLAERVRQLRNHGAAVKYHHDEVGYNSRLDELQAAILRVKLPHLDGWNERRRTLAERYTRELADLPIRTPREVAGAHHVYHLYSIQCPERDALRAYLDAHGVDTGLHYPKPLHLQTAFLALGHKPGDFPKSEALARQVLCLPLYPQMVDAHVQTVVKTIRDFYQSKAASAV